MNDIKQRPYRQRRLQAPKKLRLCPMRDDVLDTKMAVGQATIIERVGAANNNMPFFRALEADDQAIYSMRAAGMTLKEIGSVVKLRIDSVHRRIKEIERLFAYLLRFREELSRDPSGLSKYICQVVCGGQQRGRAVQVLADLIWPPGK